MQIKFEYKPNIAYMKELNYIDVFANDVPVGILKPHGIIKDELEWDTWLDYEGTKFALKDIETVKLIVNELKRYKDEHGFKYLCISNHLGGIATFFKEGTLKELGFKRLPEHRDVYLFLE